MKSQNQWSGIGQQYEQRNQKTVKIESPENARGMVGVDVKDSLVEGRA